MESYDVVVVGGGIAGLYSAYMYKQKFPRRTVCLLETSASVGGRARTKMFAGARVVQGAGVGRSPKDALLVQLLRDLDVSHTARTTTVYHVPNRNGSDERIARCIKRFEDAVDTIRAPQTFRAFGESVLGAREYARFVDAVGYTDFERADAYCTVKQYGFDDTYTHAGNVKVSVDWDDLVRKLAGFADSVRTRARVVEIDADRKIVTTESAGTFVARDRVVVAVTVDALRRLLPNHRAVKGIEGQPFLYVYAQLSADSALPVRGYTVLIDSPLRKIIPMDPARRVYMIAYNDNDDARALRAERDPAYYEAELRRVFPKARVRIEKMWKKYWATGTHFFRPFYPDTTLDNLLDDLQCPHPHVRVVGEAVSRNQGWVEGALQSVERVMVH